MDDIIGTPAVPVVSGTAFLTEESFATLKGMLASNDEGDHKMAQLVLNQLNVEHNIMYIRDLAKSYCHRMVNLRTKASRKFRDDCSLFMIAGYGDYSFARWLNNKGWLTPDRFQKLKPGIIREFSSKDDHKFYKLKFEIKDIYKHLDPEQTLQPLRPSNDE